MSYTHKISIEIKNKALKINLSYNKVDLTFDDIRCGFFLKSDIQIDKIFSPFFKDEIWHLIEEAIGYWVNDDFNETFPFRIKRDLYLYNSEILKEPITSTKILLKIDKIKKQ